MSKIIFYSKYFPELFGGSKKNNGKKVLNEYQILHSEGKAESENSIFLQLSTKWLVRQGSSINAQIIDWKDVEKQESCGLKGSHHGLFIK